jgi:hypothetical protein
MKGSRLTDLTVICARPDGQDEAVGPPISKVLDAFARHTDQIHFCGRFPNKEIDPLLIGRVVVIGEENQLAAVVLRMLRRGLLGSPETGPPAAPTPIGYVPLQRNEFSTRWKLPVGVDAVDLACTAAARPIPLVRDDAGGVLISHGEVENPVATAYVDEHQVLAGAAGRLVVRPDPTRGLAVTIERRRALRLPPKREVHLGRAVSIGITEPTIVVSDGVPRPRPLPRWTYYAHTEPLYLARPV